MSDRLPTHVLVTATIRAAAAADVFIVVRHKGDAARGTLALKINNLAGQFSLHQQVYDGARTVFMPLIAASSDESMVDAALTRLAAQDPDCWVLEIEDRAARLWFDNYL